MTKINDLFDKRVDLVCDNYSSVFTKDDVISMLSGLRAEVLVEATELKSYNPSISEMDFQNFSTEITSRLEQSLNNGSIDVYDYSSAEFSIGYHNELSIESIDVNSDCITNELSDILLDEFQKAFGKFLNTEVE